MRGQRPRGSYAACIRGSTPSLDARMRGMHTCIRGGVRMRAPPRADACSQKRRRSVLASECERARGCGGARARTRA
eukprot:6205725-Pleurochrysis_carterae.AAC.7